MTDLSRISLDAQEIVDFLGRDLRLTRAYRDIISQKIIDQAARERHITVSPEEIELGLDAICYENGLDHPAQLIRWAPQQLTTLADLKRRIREKLLSQKLAQSLFLEDAQEFVQRNPGQINQIIVYKIAVPYESLAREIFYQIEEEEVSFFEAAHLYDLDEKRRLNCGYEGKFRRYNLPPELAEILFGATIGEVIGPLKIAEQIYELFLVDDLITAPSEELYEAVLQERFNAWIDREITLYLERGGLTDNLTDE